MKADRQAKILSIIEENHIEKQEELAAKLTEAGYKVTQATVSRDIRELRLTKVTQADGRQCYQVLSPLDPQFFQRYINVLKEGYSSAEPAGNILVIRTVVGMAMAVATALDSMEFSEVVGCIAGDDTIFAATRSAEECRTLLKRLQDTVEN
ncbi:MAG: arginine repressor [Firmicutes bacterium]|nr:arginine repressor [Bacillota bacterium]